ncbi:hypothetical protein NUH30_10145 [Leptospira sp. 85282-16]|uniref:AAA family ATPase n=1 Tax=Leptospira sp. 85282-16 TaxID=2971256 RepID=UPI0021C058C2|nr:AAA family ATPase [Leptospira sp. 85282-16]MCT8334035.1 hypothetical protein [Leptospira sp. 85282-16]
MKNIKSIEVKNATFFKDFKITFSNELNCIMGGRGTGKSTLMYFLMAALNPNYQENSTIAKILKNNLGSGTIIIEIETENGIIYQIEKTINDLPQVTKLPSLEFQPIERIETEIVSDFYEAMQVEYIGKSSIERLELIDKKNKILIKEKENELTTIQIELDSNAQTVKSQNKRLAQFDEVLDQYKGVVEDFDSIKETKQEGFEDQERNEFEKADLIEKIRKEEKRYFSKAIETVTNLIGKIESEQREASESFQNLNYQEDSFHNKNILNEANTIVVNAEILISNSVSNLSINLAKIKEDLNKLFNNLIDTHEIQQGEFIKLKQKFETNREYIEKYHALSKRVNEKETLLKDREALTRKRDKLKSDRFELIKKLNQKKEEIFNLRLQVVTELNKSFREEIQITLTFGGITDNFQEKLKVALKGSGMRYNEIVPRIVENYSTDEFANVIHQKDIESLKNLIAIDDGRANALINALNETIEIYEIESLYCQDLPEFKLRIANDSNGLADSYKNSDELSMGQRCTTVLPIIFAVSNNPLIIDQPEDNLDNKFVTERIYQIVTEQKKKRQLIFITHNPNIPVLSDANQNIFLSYENRKADIDKIGDIFAVKEKIVSLLEGGEEAFRERTRIYGLENKE